MQDSRDTRRLPFYQGVVVLLLVALAGVGWRTQQLLSEVETLTPAPAAPVPSVHVTHLDERITALVAANPTSSDLSETYLVSTHATVHMHLMAPRQTCPLHLHRRSHEATVIVDGTAEVTQVHGQPSTVTQALHPAGSVVASPPFCGHKWVNPSGEAWLANLVFASPQFDGNFYVAADDPRMEAGEAGTSWNPAPELATLGAQAVRTVALPMMGGRMSGLLVAGTHAVEASRARPHALYVVAGEGTLADGTRIRPRTLVVAGAAVRITAGEGTPLALIVFDPERPAS